MQEINKATYNAVRNQLVESRDNPHQTGVPDNRVWAAHQANAALRRLIKRRRAAKGIRNG